MVLTLEGIGQNNSPRKKDVKLSVIIGELTVQVTVKLTAGSLPNDGDHFFSIFFFFNALCSSQVTFFPTWMFRYHIPRSLLKADDNVLVLFEEFGGTPDLVSIQTVTVGTVCADAYEGQTLELSCQGGNVFSRIKFASFGLPEGSCGSFNKGTCHAENTLPVVKDVKYFLCNFQPFMIITFSFLYILMGNANWIAWFYWQACLGKEKCSLKITEETFGVLRCKADAYRLAVEAVC